MPGAEDGHQDAHAAEDERVEGAAQGPPGAQEQEDEEVHGRGHGGQHDACRHTDRGYSRFTDIVHLSARFLIKICFYLTATTF